MACTTRALESARSTGRFSAAANSASARSRAVVSLFSNASHISFATRARQPSGPRLCFAKTNLALISGSYRIEGRRTIHPTSSALGLRGQ